MLGLLGQMGGMQNEWMPQTLGALQGWMAWLIKLLGVFLNGGDHVLLFGLGVTTLAFVGALLAVLLTLSLSRGVLQTQRLLLSGVVVGVVLASLNNLILQRFPSLLGALQNFMLGSVANVDEMGCLLMAVVLAICLVVTWFYSAVLDALGLGEHTAKSLGFFIGKERWVLIAVLSLATATSVAQTGLIAFVGLAAPHMVRQVVKANYKAWTELSVLMGGALLVGSDLIARTLSPAQELPIGIVTALLGGGYLLRLLSKSNRSTYWN
jgi:iron complex transport system permease protein